MERFEAIHYTLHAMQRMARRKISAFAVETTLQRGILREQDHETIIAELKLEGQGTIIVVFVEVLDSNVCTARVITAMRQGDPR